MNSTPEVLAAERVTLEEWTWVQDLIQEVQCQELAGAFAKKFWEWDLAVRQFRKVEYRRMIMSSPTENDLLQHAICLHSLLAIGKTLLVSVQNFSDEELAFFGIEHAHLTAYVAELEQSFQEWHHGFSEEDLNRAQERIFGATT